MIRPQDKRTGFNQGNNLSKRFNTDIPKKVFTLSSGKSVTAERIVVLPDELESITKIHPLNPRRQASLTLDSVRDILPTITTEGVHTEGVAVKNEQGIYLLLDSSRRRFSCIHAKKELPLWVIDEHIGDSDIISFIQTTQSVKRLSYRELGADYQTIMDENQFKKIDELASFLNLGRETCRKRLVAASVNDSLIQAFPDCEGIPNSYYGKLAKVERFLSQEKIDVLNFIGSFTLDVSLTVEEKQKQLITLMETEISKSKGKGKVSWETRSLGQFDDKNKYAKVSHSSDKRSLKIELSRLPTELYDEIIELIELKIKTS